MSQVFPPGAGERPAEPPPAASPGAAGAAGGAFVHPQGLSERSSLAEPLRAGAHQPAARALRKQDQRHHDDAPEKPATRV